MYKQEGLKLGLDGYSGQLVFELTLQGYKVHLCGSSWNKVKIQVVRNTRNCVNEPLAFEINTKTPILYFLIQIVTK